MESNPVFYSFLVIKIKQVKGAANFSCLAQKQLNAVEVDSIT